MTSRLFEPDKVVNSLYIHIKFFFDVTRNSVFHHASHTGAKKVLNKRGLTCMMQNRTKHTGTLFALAQTAMVPDIFFISWARACKMASSARRTIILFCSGPMYSALI